jgi:rubrerythrin
MTDVGSHSTDDSVQAPEEGLTGATSRRSFLAGAGGGVAAVGVGLLVDSPVASAHGRIQHGKPHHRHGRLRRGDEAILRFVAAAETLEADFWQQYNELAGVQDSEVPGGSGSPSYAAALAVLDDDMAQYIHDNTDDEITHFTFLNAYLESRGGRPVDLAPFRTLPSSTATGAQQIKRLTNLMQLTVDTTWYTRYRSDTKNPDFGDSFPPAVPDLLKGQFPAIPRSDSDLMPPDHLTAIANTAAWHFATIEQGGNSLYPQLAQRATDAEVLRVLLSIGPTETMHFQTWSDLAGDTPPVTDPTNGLVFPDLNSPPLGGEQFATNLIMPEPTIFLSRKLPIVSIIRPTETQDAAMGALQFLTADGLFRGQSQGFFRFMEELAREADRAQRLG